MTSCTTTLEEISLDRRNTPAPGIIDLIKMMMMITLMITVIVIIMILIMMTMMMTSCTTTVEEISLDRRPIPASSIICVIKMMTMMITIIDYPNYYDIDHDDNDDDDDKHTTLEEISFQLLQLQVLLKTMMMVMIIMH